MKTTIQLIQTAIDKKSADSRPRPAVIDIDGVLFESALPDHSGESIHINEIARRLCESHP